MIDERKYLLNKLPAVKMENRVINPNGGNLDIQEAIKQATPRAVLMARPIAGYFNKGNLLNSGKFLHSFIRKNLGYRRDPKGYQQIKLPNRYLIESGDCKSKSLFIFSILTNLGYKCKYKLANYDKKKGLIPSHIYVIAEDRSGKKIIIDGTFKHFNKELKPNYFELMEIQELSNNTSAIVRKRRKQALRNKAAQKRISAAQKARLKNLSPLHKAYISKKFGISEDGEISGPKLKKLAQKVKSKAQKVAKKVTSGKVAQVVKKVAKTGTKVSLATPRNAFLALVALNVRGFATSLNKSQGPRLRKAWENFGGSYSALKNAIKKGAGKKALLKDEGDGISEPVTIAASLASATPIILKLSEFLKKADQSGAGKLIKKVSDSKVLKSVQKTLQENPALKERLKNLGKEKAAKIVESAVSKASGSSGAGSTAAAAIVPSLEKTNTAEQREEVLQPEQQPAGKKNYLPIVLGAGALAGLYYATKN